MILAPPELALLVGLPGSGKSSFYRLHLAATHALVSKDLMGSARDKNVRQARQIAEALSAGRSVAADNTSLTPADRAPLLALARLHHARASAYFFDAPARDCQARNALREGRARVPEVAIWAMARRLVPPAFAEGFDAIFRVRLLSGGGFAVEEIKPG